MGLRVLSYMVQMWETQCRRYKDAKIPQSQWKLSPILPIVFYSGRRRWSTPISVAALMDLPDLLAEFVPTFRTLLLKLQETPAEALSGSAVALALRSLQAAEALSNELARVLGEVVRELEQLPEEAKPEWRRALLFVYLLIQHKRSLQDQERLVEAVEESLEPAHRVEAEEVLMTGAQALEAKGRREGRLEKGREILLELLEENSDPWRRKLSQRSIRWLKGS